jgi:hypothetical protein
MKDAVAVSVSTLIVSTRMLDFGRSPEKTQFVSRNPVVVLGVYINNSVPMELPRKIQDVIEGA